MPYKKKDNNTVEVVCDLFTLSADLFKPSVSCGECLVQCVTDHKTCKDQCGGGDDGSSSSSAAPAATRL